MVEFNYSGTVKVDDYEMKWFMDSCKECKSITRGINYELNDADLEYYAYIRPIIDQLEDYIRAKLAEEGVHFDD